MKNPDAVLNECGSNLIRGAIEYDGPDGFFDEPVADAQRTGNEGMGYLGDCLDRWSAYIDVAKGENGQAAIGLIASMLHTVESHGPAGAGDGPRLWPLALWFESRIDEIRNAFVELSEQS